MPLTQDEIVRQAVRLLDEVGLDGLSLRRLAAVLGVSAPTLYWHVRDKRQLLDLVAEAIVAEHRPPVRPAHGQPWWDWLADSAAAQYRALVSHRDAALVVAGNRPTEQSLPNIEEVLASLVAVGFPVAEAFESLLTLGHFVIGCAVEHQAEVARGAATEHDVALVRQLRESAALPTLAAALRDVTAPDAEGTLRHGIGLIVAGMRARHAELIAAPVRAPVHG